LTNNVIKYSNPDYFDLLFCKYNIYSSITVFKPLNYWEHIAVAVN